MSIRILFASYLLFWTGWFLLLGKKKWDLNRRARQYKEVVGKIVSGNFVLSGWKKLLLARKREFMQRELSDCLAYIKNIVVLGRGQTMSTELLLEELAEMTEILSPTFIDMAHCLHICENQKACQILYDAFNNDYANDIAQFLIGWENIPTQELMGTVVAYRNILLQERLTKQKKRDELISDLIYFPVVLNSMAVLLNFIYIAYFIEQREALMGIF